MRLNKKTTSPTWSPLRVQRICCGPLRPWPTRVPDPHEDAQIGAHPCSGAPEHVQIDVPERGTKVRCLPISVAGRQKVGSTQLRLLLHFGHYRCNGLANPLELEPPKIPARYRVSQNPRICCALHIPDFSGTGHRVQITPMTSRSALSIAFIRSSSRRPNGSLIFARGSVESLSTMTCDSARNPLDGFGSTVTRKAALRRSLVTGHSTTLSKSVRRSD